MRKILLLTAMFITFAISAQTVVWMDDFESYTDFDIAPIGNWTQADVDGGTAWGSQDYDFNNEGYVGTAIVFNPSTTTPSAVGTDWDVHGGSKGLYFFASGANSTTVPNDDYFITPQITIAGNGQFSMWVKSITDQYGLERFNIMISTTDTNIASFTTIDINEDLDTDLNDPTITLPYQQAPLTWTNVTVDLSAYANSSIYIAIHYESNDSFVFQTDDYQVTDDSTASIDTNENILANQVSIYPTTVANNFTIKNSSDLALVSATIFDVNGRLIASHNLNNLVGEKTINVANLTAGMYFVEIQSANNKLVKKIIKK